MSKLLETRLPLALGESVDTATFNRLIRVLELNLSGVDITISPHFNSTTSIHQAFDGTQFRDLYNHQTYPSGVGATFGVGAVTVTIS